MRRREKGKEDALYTAFLLSCSSSFFFASVTETNKSFPRVTHLPACAMISLTGPRGTHSGGLSRSAARGAFDEVGMVEEVHAEVGVDEGALGRVGRTREGETANDACQSVGMVVIDGREGAMSLIVKRESELTSTGSASFLTVKEMALPPCPPWKVMFLTLLVIYRNCGKRGK